MMGKWKGEPAYFSQMPPEDVERVHFLEKMMRECDARIENERALRHGFAEEKKRLVDINSAKQSYLRRKHHGHL